MSKNIKYRPLLLTDKVKPLHPIGAKLYSFSRRNYKAYVDEVVITEHVAMVDTKTNEVIGVHLNDTTRGIPHAYGEGSYLSMTKIGALENAANALTAYLKQRVVLKTGAAGRRYQNKTTAQNLIVNRYYVGEELYYFDDEGKLVKNKVKSINKGSYSYIADERVFFCRYVFDAGNVIGEHLLGRTEDEAKEMELNDINLHMLCLQNCDDLPNNKFHFTFE